MPPLSDAIQEYLDSRKARGIKPNTVINNRVVLRQFLTAVGNIETRNVTGRHIDMWLAARSQMAPATYNRHTSTLSTFFEWCQDRRYMPRDHTPMKGVTKRTIVRRDYHEIPADRFDELLDAALDSRDRAAIATGLYTFMRGSEIRSIKWKHTHIDGQRPDLWNIQVWKPKTGQYDELPVAQELASELLRWRLEYSNLLGETVRPDWYVIPAYHRRKFIPGVKGVLGPKELNPDKGFGRTYEAAQQALWAIGYKQQPYEGIHTLRRSGARALYFELAWERGMDGVLEVISSMLGHKSVQTTEHYLQLGLERKRRNDLLAGKQMFKKKEAKVIDLGQAREGQ